MTIDCSLNSLKNTSSQHVVLKNCFVFVLTFKKIFVHNMLWTCTFRGIQWTISCILWVNRFKNESFWKRFTCTNRSQMVFFLQQLLALCQLDMENAIKCSKDFLWYSMNDSSTKIGDDFRKVQKLKLSKLFSAKWLPKNWYS